jgi:hypothetical protein
MQTFVWASPSFLLESSDACPFLQVGVDWRVVSSDLLLACTTKASTLRSALVRAAQFRKDVGVEQPTVHKTTSRTGDGTPTGSISI